MDVAAHERQSGAVWHGSITRRKRRIALLENELDSLLVTHPRGGLAREQLALDRDFSNLRWIDAASIIAEAEFECAVR
jgi:hypothetical protein